jgi:RNA polymerase sporulation-specific sigma factor
MRLSLACPESVLRDYEGMCLTLARDFWAPGLDKDDLAQEARVGLCKAWQDFKPELGVTFGNFAWVCIRRQVLTAVKTARREKCRVLNESVSLTARVADAEGGITIGETLPASADDDPCEILIRRDTLRRQAWVIRHRSRLERRVVAGRLNGLSYEQIGPHKSVRVALKAAA